MNQTEFQQIKEAAWRRTLSQTEEAAIRAYLAANPDALTDWDEEMALSRCMMDLPDAPVSSNFASRVLQAVEREVTRDDRVKSIVPFRLNWLPRVAIACLFLGVGIFSGHEYREAKRIEIARDVAVVSSAATFPQEWLQDFDAINRLSEPPVDDELLAALQ